MNGSHLQGIKERMRRSFVRSRQVSSYGLARAYVYMLVAPHLGRLLDTAHQSWGFAKSSIYMLTFGLSHPYVLSSLSD